MGTRFNLFLLAGSALSGLAALLHLGCIVFGGSWYRALGAGEQFAQMSEAGLAYPSLVTAFIAALLTTCSLYALSGAGVIGRLPLLRPVLCLISGVYLLRGVAFIPLAPYFPDNSLTFWIASSAISLTFGLVHAVGLEQAWTELAAKARQTARPPLGSCSYRPGGEAVRNELSHRHN